MLHLFEYRFYVGECPHTGAWVGMTHRMFADLWRMLLTMPEEAFA